VRLLRRHVAGGAHHLVARALLHVREHAKVQHHHPALLGDEQVGGLDIPVHLAGAVQGASRASTAKRRPGRGSAPTVMDMPAYPEYRGVYYRRQWLSRRVSRPGGLGTAGRPGWSSAWG
jgi:hypothetical protein